MPGRSWRTTAPLTRATPGAQRPEVHRAQPVAQELDGARVGHRRPGHLEQRGLARAVGPEHHPTLARADLPVAPGRAAAGRRVITATSASAAPPGCPTAALRSSPGVGAAPIAADQAGAALVPVPLPDQPQPQLASVGGDDRPTKCAPVHAGALQHPPALPKPLGRRPAPPRRRPAPAGEHRVAPLGPSGRLARECAATSTPRGLAHRRIDDRLAVGAAVVAHVLVEVDEQRARRGRACAAASDRRSACPGCRGARGPRGRRGRARRAWPGPAGRPVGPARSAPARSSSRPSSPHCRSRGRRCARGSRRIRRSPSGRRRGSPSPARRRPRSPSRYSTIMRPWMTSTLLTRSRSTPRLSRSSRSISAS